MSQITVKQAISHIGDLKEDAPLLDVIRPWMILTGLELKDALHLNFIELLRGLHAARDKLSGVLEIMDEDQLQEAACRCFETITVYGEFIDDGEVAVQQSQRINWQSGKWHYSADPTLRQRGESSTYLEALTAVKANLDL